MPKLIMSIDGVVIKEVQLTKDRTTLGRRPYNDIVIDNLAVSGEHAVLEMKGGEVELEDLNSTNGTYLNGKAVKRQALQHNDSIEIGKYKIKYFTENAASGFDKTQLIRPGVAALAAAAPSPAPALAPAPAPSAVQPPPAAAEHKGVIKVLNGAAAGREVPLVKVVTTIGKPGVAVAAITRRPQGYVVSHVDGSARATLNGSPVGSEVVPLKSGDLIELAGIQMQFTLG
jgi:pSer/pThr/pTyr-binding forkhead associated (FHA) protein